MVVLHHTDCGITRLADYPEMLAEFFEIRVSDLDAKAVSDRTARSGATSTSSGALFRPGLLASGLVYDTDTGLVDVVVPPTTMSLALLPAAPAAEGPGQVEQSVLPAADPVRETEAFHRPG